MNRSSKWAPVVLVLVLAAAGCARSGSISVEGESPSSSASGSPPGLAKKGGVPPGLAKKGGVPPGLAKKGVHAGMPYQDAVKAAGDDAIEVQVNKDGLGRVVFQDSEHGRIVYDVRDGVLLEWHEESDAPAGPGSRQLGQEEVTLKRVQFFAARHGSI